MQLLEPAVLAVFATNFIVCAGLAFLVSFSVRYLKLSRKSFPLLVLAVFTFALLGFVTGEIMAQSRAPVVGAVLPAVLTLLGSVAIYLIGSKGPQTQAIVSSMVFCFVVALLAGALYGGRLRVEFETAQTNSNYLRLRDLGLEQNRHAVEVQRLLNYIQLLKLRKDLAEAEKLDLSRFESALEQKTSAK